MAKTNTKTKAEPKTVEKIVEKPVYVTVHTFTRQQWKENPMLQRELAQILENPTLKLAFQTIKNAALPNAKPVANLVPGITAEQMALVDSNRYHHRSGMTHAVNALFNLARPDNQPKKSADWGEMLEETE